MSIVRLDALTRRYGATVAVDRLSFVVERGELFGIVGPDGAGKTTTLRMLAGVLRPSSGEAWIEDVPVGREPERVKPHLAYMAQRFGLYYDLTVAENIAFYADLYRVPRGLRARRLERLYAFSRLGQFRDRLAGNLSGGMRQKLALCCALIHHPALLLLDEPTFGVDPVSRRDLWLILHELVGEGMTAIVSTSYLDEAERCDRVALLHEGRVLALDDPARIQTSLPGAHVVLRTAEPRRDRDVVRTHGDVRSAVLFGDRLHVSIGAAAQWPGIEASLRAGGMRVLESELTQPSLEDVFISLVTAAPQRGATP
jgi:ABC-2 type transport system ATP-binding protein